MFNGPTYNYIHKLLLFCLNSWKIRSIQSYAPSYNTGKNKTNVQGHLDFNGHYLNEKRDYRRQKRSRRLEVDSGEKPKVHDSNRPAREDEYISKAQRFVERNKEVIDSGAMFQRKPSHKAYLRFRYIATHIFFVQM